MSDRRYFADGVKAFFATLIVLWVLDVVVNISIVQELYLGRHIHAGPVDFIGLFVAEIQIALAAVVVCWIAACVLSILLRSRSWTPTAVVLLASLVSAMTMFICVRNASETTRLNIWIPAVIAVLVGVLTWWVLHFKVRVPTIHSAFGETAQLVLYPALIIGLTSQVLSHLIRGHIEVAVLNAVVTAIVSALALALAAFRSGFLKFIFRWFPPSVAVVLAGFSMVYVLTYGSNDATIHRDPTKKRPHIILIVLDTVRADHLHRFGYPYNTMPALEEWAQDAVSFTKAVSPAGWTTPAHASLFSGLPVSLHGIHYGSTRGVFHTTSYEGIEWLPDRLAENGYYCLAVNANPLALPSDINGFTRVLMPRRRAWDTMTLAGFVDDEFALFRRASERMRWRTPYVDAKRMVDIVKRAVPEGDGPVFLFVNLLDAHSPYNPPEEALELLGVRPADAFPRYFTHRKLTKRWSSFPRTRQKTLTHLYDGELRWIDLHLEKLLSWIEERYGQDAVVIVASDHGEELGEKSRVGHEYGLSQALVHVPLFMKGPYYQAGEFDQIVSLRGLHGFIVSLATGEEPELATMARVDTFGIVAERYLSGHSVDLLGSDYERQWVVLFENDVKAVGPSGFGFQLFDVSSLGFHREVEISSSPDSTRLQERIDEYWDTFRDRREEAEFDETSEEMLEKLRSLGYIK